LTGSGECYLDGFWHTGDYYHNDVIDIRDELRTELTPSSSLSGENLQVANDIRDSISVSLHIRRGDFVDVSRNISLDYYSRAINELTRVLNDFTLFVFSDEISWAEQNLNVKQPTVYVNNNSIDEGYKDMQLMSICDHNIIANSSFSWWGAWLNTNENKYVIAPSRWTKSWDVRNTDVIPGDWMVLPVNEVGN
jgi:hypothetical protein